MAAGCKERGPFARAALSEEELQLVAAMEGRLRRLAHLAEEVAADEGRTAIPRGCFRSLKGWKP
jgi:hypothetical protein